MNQNSGTYDQFPGRYRHDLIVSQMAKTKYGPREVSAKTPSNLSKTTVMRAMSGECKKMETLWEIATALNIKWPYLFDLDLKESDFRRAVRSGRR